MAQPEFIYKIVELDGVQPGYRYRVYLDPHNTDLDYVEGIAHPSTGETVYLMVEKDYWPNGKLTGLLIVLENSHRILLIQEIFYDKAKES